MARLRLVLAAFIVLAAWRGAAAWAAPAGEVQLQQAERLLQQTRNNADPTLWTRIEMALQALEAGDAAPARVNVLRAWYEMSLHRFLPARARLERAHARGQLDAVGLGLYADALVETGAYADAILVTQTMLDRYPGLAAMARAAHLRMLHGDLDGAIALGRHALKDSSADAASRAWMRVELADYYLLAGNHAQAERMARAARVHYPAGAKAMLARVLASRGDGRAAAELYEGLLRERPDPEHAYGLYRLARDAGDEIGQRRYAAMLDGMTRLDRDGLYRRLFAEFLCDRAEQAEDALRLAREEWGARPDLYSEMTLAWALLHAGQPAEAAQHARSALRLNTPDPWLRYRAAAVLDAAGDRAQAAALRSAALAVQPRLAMRDRMLARHRLAAGAGR